MNNVNKLSKYIRLNWVSLLVVGSIAIGIILIITVTGISFFHFSRIAPHMREALWARTLPYIFIFLVIGSFTGLIHTLAWIYFVFGGGIAQMTYKKVKETEVNVHWGDVVGMDLIKKEVWEVISLLKDRSKIKKIGGKVIKGVLMIGPPGTGKTYLAKAIATETGLPFLAEVGSEFVGILVGQGAMSIKKLFKKARVLAEIHGGCIVFIDEIDSIALPRVTSAGISAREGHNATINQLLAEMDGVRQAEDNIVVIGATNVSEDALDPALMRAGRFDRKIYFDYPNLNDRKELLNYYLKKIRYDHSISINTLAVKTVMLSPADIANMIREATLVSMRSRREIVTMRDISEAYDRILFGLKSGLQLSEKEKLWVAYHEAGHAIIAYLKHPTTDVVKATIIPRKGYLGYAHPVPREEIHIDTKDIILAKIKTFLASYVAEKIKFGSTGSGVNYDFAQALKLAHDMVYKYGMGESAVIGNFQSLYSKDSGYDISQDLKSRLDNDIQKILKDCQKEVEEILIKERDILDYFARELLKKEELDYDEIVDIFKKFGKERQES
ncbi:MAG: AAA family ATPase [Candidatus Omnitrophica bacterium]|nr:AAA family ATPase [Candidatus Omnitrophota bacterium]